MKTRLLITIGMILLPLILPQGFSQCIYNDDWPDAPCFDTGPVSHSEFYMAWAPYYEHKGSAWMETKKVDMDQALEQGTFEEWVEEIENYNVYRYYLSRNEIQSQSPYDGFFVTLDPNFANSESIKQEPTPEPISESTPHEEFTDEQICAHGAKLIDGICTVEKEIHDNAFSKYRALFIFSMMPVWFVLSGIYLAFGRNHKKLVAISLTIMGIFWILGIYTNTLPVSFG